MLAGLGMKAEMSEVELLDLAILIKRGITPKYVESDGICVINQKCIRDQKVSFDLARQTSTEKKISGEKFLQDYDVLVNSTGVGTLGRVAQMGKVDKKITVDSHITIVRGDKNKVDLKYFGYLVKNKQKSIEALAEGSTGQTELSRVLLGNIKVIFHKNIDEQKKIAHILSSLDDKIELNRKMDEMLEAMAQAIFKSWFVDFDPVHAKAAAKTQADLDQAAKELGISKEVLELFPSRFVESEMGMIPKGWEVKPLDKIAHYQNGLALQKFRPKDEKNYLPVLKIAQLKKGYADAEEKADPNIKEECIVYDGDVIFSWSGSLVVDIWCGGKVALNQHLFKVTSKEYSKWFFYLWTKQHLDNFQRVAAAKAVTMGHIKRSHLSEAICVIPDESVFKRAEKLIAPLVDRIITNRLENNELVQTRDTLLPKLLSGELDVSEVKI
jgi:type I restriction enzyme S subunit